MVFQRAFSCDAIPQLMNLEEWYLQTPIVTRCYLTMSFLITAGCALEVKNNFFFLCAEHFSSEKSNRFANPEQEKERD